MSLGDVTGRVIHPETMILCHISDLRGSHHTGHAMRGVGTLGDVVSGLGTYRLYILSRKVL